MMVASGRLRCCTSRNKTRVYWMWLAPDITLRSRWCGVRGQSDVEAQLIDRLSDVKARTTPAWDWPPTWGLGKKHLGCMSVRSLESGEDWRAQKDGVSNRHAMHFDGGGARARQSEADEDQLETPDRSADGRVTSRRRGTTPPDRQAVQGRIGEDFCLQVQPPQAACSGHWTIPISAPTRQASPSAARCNCA